MRISLSILLALCALLWFGRAFRQTARKRYLLGAAVLAALLLLRFFPAPPPEAPLPPEAAAAQKQALHRAQAAFAPWYAAYKKELGRIDFFWQRYYRIFEAFENDEISVQTAHVRFDELEQQIGALRDKLARCKAPAALSGEAANAAERLLQKTLDYADRQYKIVRESTLSTAPAAVTQESRHRQQVERLRKIQVLYNPSALDIASEIQLFKALLSAPPEKNS